ncbi:MAG: FAD-binding oxidoreductase [Rhodospirillaceae bacterium]|jgi:FAD/FMN-containing dehydrogenase|nr:FAD-binding oxidoreductase [Rhodospirillaceae bacterium]MBT5239327.1 FAD-binding oxidoreductase [Rhodospirillaceae bacterium]MBT5566345.1 FAD-binding oxidoreductase [Rhodospirillaceae bacterium]MBT6088438.1 FAD-binding oxidoreductase [Rhodospirillaceae bacterium]MBT6961108.1 FAD-binding oxidoreductase [Rhodospirillaceae bacterium]
MNTVAPVHNDVVAETLESTRRVIGDEAVVTDEETCAYHSQDVFATGPTVAAVIRPTSVDGLAKAVNILTTAGIAVFPRGGGYSYTDAYLPTGPNGVSLDMTGLSEITEVNVEDMFVTVQAGCTWEALDLALAPHGVRAEFWGPLSGFKATIGGGMSQGAASLGSSKDGISAEAVLGMEIVTADGTVFATGSAAQHGKSPFFRNYGPDLTGLFCGDAGALGIKATVTLRLQRRAKLTQGLSFGFDSFEAAHKAMSGIAASNRATEVFGFTRRAMEGVVASKGLWEDLKIMYAVGRASGGVLSGFFQVMRMALAGRRWSAESECFVHCAVEADNRTELKGHIQTIRDAVGGRGRDIPNTMPAVMRASPFMPYPVVGMDAKRMLPLHAILPFSKVVAFHAALESYFAKRKPDMDAINMTTPSIFGTLSTNGFLYEPVLYWPDQPDIFHERNTPEELLAPMRENEPCVKGRTLAKEMFKDMVTIMHEHSGVHLQIGKAYPYLRDRSDMTINLVKQIKAQTDPDGLLNPGALGL